MEARNIDPIMVAKLLEDLAYEVRCLSATVSISSDGILISQDALNGASAEIKGNLFGRLMPNDGWKRVEEAVRLFVKEQHYLPRNAYECINEIDDAFINMSLDEELDEGTLTPEFLMKAYKSIGSEFMGNDSRLEDDIHTFLQEQGLRD